jgi:hypothetical protein
MISAPREAIRSLQRESGRQADFYHARGNSELTTFWSDIEAAASDCLREGGAIMIQSQLTNTPIIKGCQQAQQLHNANVIQALQ